MQDFPESCSVQPVRLYPAALALIASRDYVSK